MTYERAGEYYRAMMLDVSAMDKVALSDIDKIGLRLPYNKLNPEFADFLAHNADRLQLFDEPVGGERNETL
jgi:hypothetical protein